MSSWRRLSVRRGRVADDGPHDGVPEHLITPILDWISRSLLVRVGPPYDPRIEVDGDLVLRIAASAQVPLRPTSDRADLATQLLNACSDDDVCLDILDTILRVRDGAGADLLDRALDEGRSAWMVAPHQLGLQSRVDQTALLAFEQATASPDVATAELQHAWLKAYGRDQDASDAWDHAIKAAEAVLVPLVVPNQHKAQFGHVLGQLKSQGARWKLALPGPSLDHSIDPLVVMLQMLWPNPDRHATGDRRSPTIDEARAVVHLAVLIVQWARVGAITST